jgi:hypothetical protein
MQEGQNSTHDSGLVLKPKSNTREPTNRDPNLTLLHEQLESTYS